MKKLRTLFIVLLAPLFFSCGFVSNHNSDGDLEDAKKFFIEESQIMSEKDALAKEINYYRPPQIIRAEYIGTLTGKNLIHIANQIEKENQEQREALDKGLTWCAVTYNVSDVKEYGINNPNTNVAKLYLFGGDFVHYSNGIQRIYSLVLFIPDMKKYMEVEGKYIDSINTNLDLSADNYKFIWQLPIYEDRSL